MIFSLLFYVGFLRLIHFRVWLKQRWLYFSVKVIILYSEYDVNYIDGTEIKLIKIVIANKSIYQKFKQNLV